MQSTPEATRNRRGFPAEPGQAYVGEERAIQMIVSVGFKKDREKFAAFGESDRFTLKFRRPAM